MSPALDAAAAALAVGRPVLLLDDLNPPHHTEVVFAAAHATPALVAHAVRHTSGFLTVAITDTDADRLDLPPMWPRSTRSAQPGFTVTADATDGINWVAKLVELREMEQKLSISMPMVHSPSPSSPRTAPHRWATRATTGLWLVTSQCRAVDLKFAAIHAR